VKVGPDYLNRSPLLAADPKTVVLPDGSQVTFPVNSEIELFAGKTKALVERVAVRDLYDISQIGRRVPEPFAEGDEVLFRRVVLTTCRCPGPSRGRSAWPTDSRAASTRWPPRFTRCW
jgi:hypothetical protein